MKILQRVAFAFALGVFLPVISADASAQQKYPTKPVRLVVSTTPGSAPDILARLIRPKLGEFWNQLVVIENRPGVGGSLAAAMVAKAVPDGYTIHIVSPAFAIRAAREAKALLDNPDVRRA